MNFYETHFYCDLDMDWYKCMFVSDMDIYEEIKRFLFRYF